MHSYRELFRTPEFTPLFLANSVRVAAQTMSSLTLGTQIYWATGSPLLSALAIFGLSLTQLIGASTVLSSSDRLPPRALMTGLSVAFAVSTAALAIPGLPVWVAFAIVACLGLGASLGGAARYGLVSEVVTESGYLLGRSLLNMSVGVMQICGFAAGGVLIASLSPRGTLLTSAALYAVAAAVTQFGLIRRPARAAGRPSVKDTWRINARLWSSTARRHIYLAISFGGWSRRVKIGPVRVASGWGRCRVSAGVGAVLRARGVGVWLRAARDAGLPWDANLLSSLALGS